MGASASTLSPLPHPPPFTDAEWAQLVPKVENHVHLDGSWDYDYMLEILLLDGLVDSLPEDGTAPVKNTKVPIKKPCAEIKSLAEKWKGSGKVEDYNAAISMLKQHVTVDKDTCCDLFDFLTPFVFFTSVIEKAVTRDEKHLEELAFCFVKRQRDSNVVYTEARYNPHLFLPPELQGADVDSEVRYQAAVAVVAAATRGFRRGENEFGISVNTILCCICFQTHWSSDCARMLREAKEGVVLKEFAEAEGSHLVSIDVAAGELHFDVESLGEPHVSALTQSWEDQYDVCIHAGEATGGTAAHVEQAVLQYRAVRIGHGYKVFDEIDILDKKIPLFLDNLPDSDRRKGQRIHFECCPTSSLNTGGFSRNRPWTEHPLRKLYERGASCGINSDDPSVMDVSLTDEYVLCLEKIALTRGDIRKMALQQAESCFCDEEKKREIQKLLEEGYARVVGEGEQGYEDSEAEGLKLGMVGKTPMHEENEDEAADADKACKKLKRIDSNDVSA